MYYVYLHRFNKDVVYVGMSSNLKRPYNMSDRTPEYKNYLKYRTIDIEIIEVNNKYDASVLEKKLINSYRDTVFNTQHNTTKKSYYNIGDRTHLPNNHSNRNTCIHWHNDIDDKAFRGWENIVKTAINMNVDIIKFILYIKEINIYKTNR